VTVLYSIPRFTVKYSKKIVVGSPEESKLLMTKEDSDKRGRFLFYLVKHLIGNANAET